jgi:hypothetical protein
MRRRKSWCCLGLLFFVVTGVVPQDSSRPDSSASDISPTDSSAASEEDTTSPARQEESAAAEAEDASADPAGVEDSLLKNTLAADIDTAGYYELLAWCRQLGLPETGTRDALMQRLRGYFGVGPSSVGSVKKEPGGRTITIHSANRLEYFTLETIDQEYIRISDGVSLEIRDGESGTVHTIRADTILFNQEEKTITARGNIEYSMKEGSNTDVFTGETLTFNADTWEGVFLQGSSQQDQTIDGRKLRFTFSGESIQRFADDSLILSDGIITSCDDGVAPHYRIRARKIWILGPGEWAVLGAVLYVGEVPVFYLPAFFRPGDEFVFHPSFGFRDSDGFFLQTTTYLLGQKQESDESVLSFLQIADLNADDLTTELDGLFLRKTDEVSGDERTRIQYYRRTKSYLRIMFDAYTRLGFFTGVEGDFSDLDLLKSLYFYLGIGRSREIISTADGYTTQLSLPDGTYGSIWHDSGFFGIDTLLPFRYGTDLDVALKNNWFSLDLELPFYSDKYFLRDFAERQESVQWFELFGISGTGTSTPRTISTQKWLLDGDIRIPTSASVVRPYIGSLMLDEVALSLYWRSKSDNHPEYGYSRSFFYPDSYKLPVISGRMSGSLLGGRRQRIERERREALLDSKVDFRAPWDADADEDETASTKQAGLREPEFLSNVPLKRFTVTTPVSQSLTYSLSPDFQIDNKTDSNTWETPEEIDFSRLYSVLDFKGTGNIKYTITLFEGIFQSSDSITILGSYKKHLSDEAEDVTGWDQFMRQDRLATYMKLSNAFTATLRPLKLIEPFSGVTVTYSLTTDFFKIDYDDDEEDFMPTTIEWEEDFITKHSVGLNVPFKILDNSQRITFDAVLPPMDKQFVTSLSVNTGPLNQYFKVDVRELDEDDPADYEWDLKPITWRGRLTFIPGNYAEQQLTYDYREDDDEGLFTKGSTKIYTSLLDNSISFSQTLTYDLEDLKPLESTTVLRLWVLDATFQAREAHPFEFDPEEGWLTLPETGFFPYRISAGLKLDYASQPLWKNRIQWAGDMQASWNMNLLKYTDTAFIFKLGFDLNIYKFLRIKFSSTSENKAVYRYIPSLSEGVQKDPLNPFVDLLKSFNFFDRQDRIESKFNIQRLGITVAHRLHDWDLNITYEGKPELEVLDDGSRRYEWTPRVSFIVSWDPIPEIESTVRVIDDEMSF